MIGGVISMISESIRLEGTQHTEILPPPIVSVGGAFLAVTIPIRMATVDKGIEAFVRYNAIHFQSIK
jgi:hypothetical protein